MTPTSRFRVLPSSAYQRDVKKLVRRNKQLLALVRDLQYMLSDDPYNRTKAHDITRLTDVNPEAVNIEFDPVATEFDTTFLGATWFCTHSRIAKLPIEG